MMQEPRSGSVVIHPRADQCRVGAELKRFPLWVAPPASPLHPRTHGPAKRDQLLHIPTEVAEGSLVAWGRGATRVPVLRAARWDKGLQRTAEGSGHGQAVTPMYIEPLAKPPLWQGTGILPGLAGTRGPRCPRDFTATLQTRNKKLMVRLDHILSRGSGRPALTSRLTHTLFIQSFKYPIVSVFSTLIFSILMIWSPALALLGLVAAWGFFSFFFFSPFMLTSCRARGEGG